METPSSMRRVTRSQTLLASAENRKQQEPSAEKPLSSRSRNPTKPDRSVLLDITNDSPIVGLAMGRFKTPSSAVAKNKGDCGRQAPPGSGEALLRGQVKTLLQKVGEEAELVKLSSKIESAPFQGLLNLLRSPTELLAPTPANTPEIAGLIGCKEEFKPLMQPVQEEDDPKLPQVEYEVSKQEVAALESQECQINRALLFDSPEKAEISESSVLTFQGSGRSYVEKYSEDDCSSAWSIQVNACSQGEEDEEKATEDHEEDEEKEEEEEDWYEEEDELSDLCEGLEKMSVQEKRGGFPDFEGKHKRFIYNSDDEIEREEEEVLHPIAVSPNVLCLKGLPLSEGKHLRFQEEED